MDLETMDLLGYQGVLQIIAGFATTPHGKAEIRAIRPGFSLEQIEQLYDEIAEASDYRAEKDGLELTLPDPQPLLESLSQPGTVLSPSEILAARDYLRFARNAREDLGPELFPHLASHFSRISLPIPLLDLIEESIDDNGEIRESAHPELAKARKNHERFREEVTRHLSELLRGSKARHLIPEPFITQRADRYVVPVRADQQKAISGIVHGSSSSGATVFLEPISAVELNNQLIYHRDREQHIIHRILAKLSAELGEKRQEIEQIIEGTGILDARFACANFSEQYSCSRPSFTEAAEILFRQARHPLLTKTLGQHNVVPIDLEVGPVAKVLVISGPNTGGKTAALKTAGLLSLLALSGLPVTAREARLPALRGIYADIGDQQSITEQLSTFSSHVLRLNTIVAARESDSLFLLDELGRGTDPTFGSALAIATLDYLRERGSFVLTTTHHRAVKSFAASQKGVRNASVALHADSLTPSYVIEYGVAGGSSALDMAEQIGLLPEIVRRARSLLDDVDTMVEGYLQELRDELSKLSSKRHDLDLKIAEFEALEHQLRENIAQQERRRTADFERTLKELGKDFLAEGKRYLKSVSDRAEANEIRKKLRRREAALKEAFRRRMQSSRQIDAENLPMADFVPGDLVYHPFFRLRGRVLAVKGQEISIEAGGKTVTARAADLQKLESKAVTDRSIQNVSIQVVQDTDPEINLVGKRVDDATEALDKFLDRAFVSRLQEVRIIHGFGTGHLKNSVREFLRDHPHVDSFASEGGSTRVYLKS